MRSSHPRSQHVGTLMPRNSLRGAYGRDKRSEHHHGFVHGPGRSVEHRQSQRISLTPEIHRPCVHVGRHQFGLPSTADEPGMPNRWGAIHERDHAARHAARCEPLSHERGTHLGIQDGHGGTARTGLQLCNPPMRHRPLPCLTTAVPARHLVRCRDADLIEVMTGDVDRCLALESPDDGRLAGARGACQHKNAGHGIQRCVSENAGNVSERSNTRAGPTHPELLVGCTDISAARQHRPKGYVPGWTSGTLTPVATSRSQRTAYASPFARPTAAGSDGT